MKTFVRNHYHRVILVCCFFVLFANQGLPATGFNVYQSYLIEIPGVGPIGGSGILTIRALVSLVVMFFVAAFYRRIDARWGVCGATLLTALGFLIYGLFPNLIGLCIGSVFTGIGYGLGGMVATTLILGNWFQGSLGKAAGFIGMGSGAASLLIPVGAAALIKHVSLSAAFLVEAGLALALAFIFGLVLRAHPRQIGMQPAGKKAHQRETTLSLEEEGEEKVAPADSTTAASATTTPTASTPVASAPAASAPTTSSKATPVASASTSSTSSAPDLTAKRNLTRGEHFALMVAVVLIGGIAVTGFAYFSVLLTSSGIDRIVAAALTALGGGCLTIGKFACGWSIDKWGTRVGSLTFFAILFVGLIICGFLPADSVSGGVAAAFFYCTGVALATTGIAVWSLELSTPDTSLKLVRDLNIAYAGGGFLFNMLPGPLDQITGSYSTTYALFALLCIASALLIGFVYTHHQGRL
jgi:MFS family permease